MYVHGKIDLCRSIVFDICNCTFVSVSLTLYTCTPVVLCINCFSLGVLTAHLVSTAPVLATVYCFCFFVQATVQHDHSC